MDCLVKCLLQARVPMTNLGVNRHLPITVAVPRYHSAVGGELPSVAKPVCVPHLDDDVHGLHLVDSRDALEKFHVHSPRGNPGHIRVERLDLLSQEGTFL